MSTRARAASRMSSQDLGARLRRPGIVIRRAVRKSLDDECVHLSSQRASGCNWSQATSHPSRARRNNNHHANDSSQNTKARGY